MSVSVKQYLFASAVTILSMTGIARSEPTLDNLLGTVGVSGSASCAHIDVSLNRPVNIHGFSPAVSGQEVSVGLDVLGVTQNKDEKPNSEAASVAPQNAAKLGSVSYDPNATSGPQIHLSFNRLTAFKLRRGDNRHLMLDVAPIANAAKCLGVKLSEAEQPESKGDILRPGVDAEENSPKTPGQEAAKALAEGKDVLAEGDFNRASAFFTKAHDLGTGQVKQTAQEMLGLAHERAGQMAFARAEYETYLNTYPTGLDAARVKQRLSGVLAAMEGQANKQFALRQQKQVETEAPVLRKTDLAPPSVNPPPVAQSGGVVAAPGLQVTSQGMKSNLVETPKDPRQWTWIQNGSVAQYYYADQNYVPAVVGGPLFGNGRLFQNEILSSFDYYRKGENDAYAVEMRASGFNEQGFGDMANVSSTSASTVYLDGKLKDPGIGARIGRQSRSTGGVFGRFDGANVYWQPSKAFKAQAVVGSPVFGRNAIPFADSRYFYGVSLDYTMPGNKWAGGLYAVQQMVSDITDRSAIGGEVRYSAEKGSGFVAADYDLYFKEFNNAYATANVIPFKGTTVYATVDYRKMPFLLTSNALMGQQNIGSLQELRDAIGIDNLYQCALDRTASAQTESGGVSQQFNEKWMGSVDGTLAYYRGTPPSVACSVTKPNDFFTPDPGFNFYGSATISGSEVFRANDTLTASFRYSNSGTYVGYMLDGSYRFQVHEKLRFMPRFQTSIRTSTTSDQMQYLAGGSVHAYYKLRPNWNLDAELGARWQNTVNAGVNSPQLDIIASLGYRWDFQ